MPQQRPVRKAHGGGIGAAHSLTQSAAATRSEATSIWRMSGVSDETGGPAGKRRAGGDERAKRLAEELRANLKRRKAQARSRKSDPGTGAAERRPEDEGGNDQ